MNLSKRGFFTRLQLAAAMCVGLVVSGLADYAVAQPTVAELLPKCPTLNSSDETLKTFEFTGVLAIAGARIEFAWSRADGYFAALTDPKTGVPIVVATDDRFLQFIPADGALELHSDFRLTLNLKVDNEGRLVLGFGRKIGAKGKFAGVEIDPASFAAAVDAANWQQALAPGLRYAAPSPSGKSRVFVDFDPTQAYPLKRLELRLNEEAQPLLLIDDLRVNQPLRRKLKPFPKDGEFPPELLIARPADGAVNETLSQVAMMLKITTRISAVVAIDDPALRADAESLGKIDWEAAKANRAKFGPALIKLFAREAP